MILRLPFFAASTELLFETTDRPMTLPESQSFLDFSALLPLQFAFIVATAIPTVNLQAVRPRTILVKVAFRLPLRTDCTAFLLHAPNRTMALFVSVVLPSHCLNSSQTTAFSSDPTGVFSILLPVTICQFARLFALPCCLDIIS